MLYNVTIFFTTMPSETLKQILYIVKKQTIDIKDNTVRIVCEHLTELQVNVLKSHVKRHNYSYTILIEDA